jgi:alpha-galactosidase/6-phospho-beta-glucosidase family protein
MTSKERTALRRVVRAQEALERALHKRDEAVQTAQALLTQGPRYTVVNFSELGASWSANEQLAPECGAFVDAQTPTQKARAAALILSQP